MKKLSIILLIAVLVYGCKKKKNTSGTYISKPDPPAPAGKMEGTYQWYAGDSVTADLILTTIVLNCQYCLMQGCDYYNSNLPVAKVDGTYYVCTNNYKTDSLMFSWNSKAFKYKRK